MKKLWMLLAISCATSMAAEVTLVIPKISKSDEVPAEGDPLHARYEAAWAKYEQAIATIISQVTEALDKEFNKAADAGSLDSADKWDKKKKAFLDTQTVTVEVPDKPKRPAPKKPKGDAAPSFEEVLEAAQQETNSAFLTLKRNYENLVTEYTRDRNLDRAKALRDELAGLATKPVKRPAMVEMKPATAPQIPIGIFDMAWHDKQKNRKGSEVFDFLADGTVKRNGEIIGKWVKSGQQVQIRYDDHSRGVANLRFLTPDTFEGGQVTNVGTSSDWKGVRRK